MQQPIYRQLIISLICVLTSIGAVRAQQFFIPALEPDDSTFAISLLTCAPGSDIYELEGHTALRLEYAGTDLTVNWGLFDFNSPGFVYRFVKGETDYSVGVIPTHFFLDAYRQEGRRVTQQTLNLSFSEAAELIRMIDANLHPQNKTYRYNYLLDNCSTRPLTMLEQAVGQKIQLHSSFKALSDSRTFRDEMRYFHRNYPWYQFGVDLALGSGLDGKITDRLTMFAPIVMSELIGSATIVSDGRSISLVKSTEIIVDGPADGPVLPPTQWYASPLFVAILLLLGAAALSFVNTRRGRSSRLFDFLLFAAIGFAGLIVAFLVFVSTHQASSPNWLLLWLTPLALIVPIFQWWRKTQKIVRLYHCYNIGASSVLILIFLIGIQSANPAFYPLILATMTRSATNLHLYRNATK